MLPLIKLLLAHFLLHFLLLPKKTKRFDLTALPLYGVGLLQGGLTGLFFLPEMLESGEVMWPVILIPALIPIAVAGLRFGLIKVLPTRTMEVFVQLAYILFLALLWLLVLYEGELHWPEKSADWAVHVLALFLLSTPSAQFIKWVMSRWEEQMKPDAKSGMHFEDREGRSLPEAGTVIGVLERVMAYLLLISGQWAGLGFLIAAKSIFRFGDLNRNQNRQFTEYVLIGTLLSFLLAIVAAQLVNSMIPALY